jgi:hypothetical protein
VQEKKPYAAWNQTQAVHPVARLYIDWVIPTPAYLTTLQLIKNTQRRMIG